jgi:hypothetical protein
MPDEWNTYRTRFLVRAKQLIEPLTFVDTLGRQQSGNTGDYLVEFAAGILRIAPREIFEDVYVVMEAQVREGTRCCPLPTRAESFSVGQNLRI